MKTLVQSISLISALIVMTACGKSAFSPLAQTSLDNPSQIQSSISVSQPDVADGTSPVQVELTLKNAEGQPLPGLTMSISLSGSQNTIVPCTPSDASGISHCWVYSTLAEVKTITATGSVTMSQQVSFVPPVITPSTAAIVSAGGVLTAVGGQRAIVTAGIVESSTVLTDSSNAIRILSSILSTITD